jgi:hypothetical protein
MPKVNPRNEVGTIVHAVSNRVLSDHTAKNIDGNLNYAKMFLQGTIINVFDGRTPGGNAVWILTVEFEMHSEDPALGVELKRVAVHRQHCTLGPVPAGKNPQCSVNFTDSIGEPDHALKGLTTYLPNAEGRAVTASTITAASPAHPVSLLPASHITETAGDEIEVIIVPPALTPIDAAPHAAARKKRRRERRTPLLLLLRPQPTMHQLQRQRHLPPPPRRKARRPARRSRTSPSTFGRLRCGCRLPI